MGDGVEGFGVAQHERKKNHLVLERGRAVGA